MGILIKRIKKKNEKLDKAATDNKATPFHYQPKINGSTIPDWLNKTEQTQETELKDMRVSKDFAEDNALVALLPKETMSSLSSNPIISAYKTISEPKVSTKKWESLSSEEIASNFNKIKLENEVLITKIIPAAKTKINLIAKEIIGKVPTVQLEATRILRKSADKKLSVYRREVNEIREKTAGLAVQLKTIIEKFKNLESSLSQKPLSDKDIIKSLSSLSKESTQRINKNIDYLSADNTNTESKNMYKNVLQALKEVIVGVKKDIDSLKSDENDILEKMKDVELKFQFQATEISGELQNVEVNVEKEIRNSNAYFELILEKTSIIVSGIQKQYNQKLISLEEEEFQGKLDNLVRSIEVSKIGIDYMSEIDAIEQEIDGIDTSNFSDENVIELTQEVESLVGKGKEK